MTETYELQVVEPSAIATLDRAEIDIQISTAKRYPRTVSECVDEAVTLATMSEDVAKSCLYTLKRKDKPIVGPSVRLAEIMANSWRNIRVASRVVDITDTQIIAQGICHDLEKNVSRGVTVTRRITRQDGSRYSNDMITVAANAACSIAARNAIFAVVPRSFVLEVFNRAAEVAVGKGKTLADRIKKMFDRYQSKWGVTREQVLNYLGRADDRDIDVDDLKIMLGLDNALEDGTQTTQVFHEPRPQSGTLTPEDLAGETYTIDPDENPKGAPLKLDIERKVIKVMKALKLSMKDFEGRYGKVVADLDTATLVDVLSDLEAELHG